MISSMRSLALAAAGFVVMTFVVPAYAITLNPDPADFSVAESPGQYTVSNNSTAWWIWGFAVSNPGAVGGATATSTFTNWAGLVTQLDFGQSVLLPAFAYATGDADLSNINTPILLPANVHLGNYIAPGTVVDKFHFTPGAVASDFGLLLIDANGDISQVNGVATDGTTPLPAALPLFASGAGVIGFFGWRRKRKALPV